MKDPLRVTSLHALARQRLLLGFADGASGISDIGDLLEGPLAHLKDAAVFRQAFVDPRLGSVAWPDGSSLPARQLRERLEPDSWGGGRHYRLG